MARIFDRIAAAAAIPEGETEGIIRLDAVRGQRLRRNREWLRRRQFLARRTVLRHLAFHHGNDRLAGFAVEGEKKPRLGRLQHRIHRAALIGHGAQRRLRRYIVIPYIMMHGLERPHQSAGFDVECHHAVGIAVIARPVAGIEIRAGR